MARHKSGIDPNQVSLHLGYMECINRGEGRYVSLALRAMWVTPRGAGVRG